MLPIVLPPRDPVTEVFDALLHARRAAPAKGGEWKVAVRGRTGQLLVTFVLGSEEQVLALAERLRPLGYRMARNEWEGGQCYDFSFDRRAANECFGHPARRAGD